MYTYNNMLYRDDITPTLLYVLHFVTRPYSVIFVVLTSLEEVLTNVLISGQCKYCIL